MPELPVKETRLPELHLPEISRKDIMRSLSEMRMPDVDLPDSVTRCLTGLVIIDATSIQVTDACTGMLIELKREPLP